MSTTESHPQLDRLDEAIGAIWNQILTHPLAKELTQSGLGADRRLYALYIFQVYHYASHTARNQALVGVNLANVDTQYQKYCFEHALEETGHELMALHDLRALGLSLEEPRRDVPRPLPATELLIAYLYFVSTQGRPVSRLGYSYWAERSYDFIRPVITSLQSKMSLASGSMSFFFAHSKVDEKHADDVRSILLRVCKSPEDWAAVRRTAEVTLQLTAQILEQVYGEYKKLRDGQDSEYALLQKIAPPTAP